jgi:hypothetical protein
MMKPHGRELPRLVLFQADALGQIGEFRLEKGLGILDQVLRRVPGSSR